jgi:hypothetical protein
MKNRLFLFAGMLSFVSAFFVIAGLVAFYFAPPILPQGMQPVGDLSQSFVFLFAPVLLLPAILAVYRLLSQDFPRLALVSLLLGLIGFGGTLGWSVSAALFIQTFTEDQKLVLFVEMMLMGLWTLLTAVAIGLYESKNFVRHRRSAIFYGFFFLSGILGGLTMILYGWSLLPSPPPFASANVTILIWLLSYPLWLIGLGICLLAYTVREPEPVSIYLAD